MIDDRWNAFITQVEPTEGGEGPLAEPHELGALDLLGLGEPARLEVLGRRFEGPHYLVEVDGLVGPPDPDAHARAAAGSSSRPSG